MVYVSIDAALLTLPPSLSCLGSRREPRDKAKPAPSWELLLISTVWIFPLAPISSNQHNATEWGIGKTFSVSSNLMFNNDCVWQSALRISEKLTTGCHEPTRWPAHPWLWPWVGGCFRARRAQAEAGNLLKNRPWCPQALLKMPPPPPSPRPLPSNLTCRSLGTEHTLKAAPEIFPWGTGGEHWGGNAGSRGLYSSFHTKLYWGPVKYPRCQPPRSGTGPCLAMGGTVLTRSLVIWSSGKLGNTRLVRQNCRASNLLASLGHTLIHKQKLMSKKKVLSKFTILCWAAFIAILGHMRPAGWTPWVVLPEELC